MVFVSLIFLDIILCNKFIATIGMTFRRNVRWLSLVEYAPFESMMNLMLIKKISNHKGNFENRDMLSWKYWYISISM